MTPLSDSNLPIHQLERCKGALAEAHNRQRELESRVEMLERVAEAGRQILATRMNAEVLFSTAAAREQAPKSVAAHSELTAALEALDAGVPA